MGNRYADWMAGLALLYLLLAWISPADGMAQDQDRVVLTVQTGFDGYCKDGAWLPVRVSVENHGPAIEGRLEVRLARAAEGTIIYAQPVSLPTVSRKETTIPIFLDRYYFELTAALVSGNRILAETSLNPACAGRESLLAGLLASSPSAFNGLAELQQGTGKTMLALLKPGDLPALAAALQPLDVLIISDTDSGLLSGPQRLALQLWLADGGQLLVTGGAGWQKTAAGLSDLLPLRPEDAQVLQSLTALQAFTGAATAPIGAALVASGPLTAGSEVLVYQDGLPLVSAKKIGAGRVIYLAADPALEPLRNWDGGAALFRMLLTGITPGPAWTEGFQDWDFANRAAASLPRLGLPPAGLVLGFLFTYVIAIGPANYLILRRLNRRELAWFSIPALVLVFSALALLAGRGERGVRPALSRLAVVQSWPGTPLARVDGLVGVYSPVRSSYQLSIEPPFLMHAASGNMAFERARSLAFMQTPAGGTSLPDLRSDVSGFYAVAVAGQIPAPQLRSDLTIQLGSNSAILHGSLANTSGLVLEDAVLMAPGKVQRLGEFQPNEQRDIQLALSANQRATASGKRPAGSSSSASSAPIYQGPGPGNTPLAEDLLGIGDYYRDLETFRRFALVSALAPLDQYGATGRGGGIYLAGWSAVSPLPAGLDGAQFSTSDSTLYLFALDPSIVITENRLEFSPGLFTWNILAAGTASPAAAYEAFLPSGSFSLSFQLALPVDYQSVVALTLHLESYGARGPSGLRVALWDFSSAAWVEQPATIWGITRIPRPESFVGPGGEIRVQLTNLNDEMPQYIQQVDFTLAVEGMP